MSHDTQIVTTITIALAAAFVGGLVATRLHLPAIVGYLLAGVAIGPFTPGLVADSTVTKQLAEIGVVLLMFGVGIHFSPADLLAVRHVALPGALIHGVVITGVAMLAGMWWGWGIGGSLVFGLAISVASTVVLLRALTERGEVRSAQGKVAIGWLIVEDLRTVLVLVLLPALAGPLGGQPSAGGSLVLEAGVAIGKLVLLAAFMAVVGSRVVPYLLVRVARTGSRELFTLGVLAVALGIAYGASLAFGVSLALGAFLAGVTVGESPVSERAAADALPMRDAFAVLFFVSVGMLFDPAVLTTSTWRVVAVLAAIVVLKPLVAGAIVLLYGLPLCVVLTVAAGLGQVGEFSFILAELGRSFGLLNEEGYALIIVGSLLSITINPLLFKAIGPVERWLAIRQERRHADASAGKEASA